MRQKNINREFGLYDESFVIIEKYEQNREQIN